MHPFSSATGRSRPSRLIVEIIELCASSGSTASVACSSECAHLPNKFHFCLYFASTVPSLPLPMRHMFRLNGSSKKRAAAASDAQDGQARFPAAASFTTETAASASWKDKCLN
eukprot:5073642-Pleurochrysis_carterae.AAC.1